MTQAYPLIIDGMSVSTDNHLDVINPADGRTFALCPAGTSADLDRAVAAARRAFPGWAATPDADRKAAVNALADILDANAGELAELITREQGKTLSGLGSQWELGGAAAWTRYTAALDLPVEYIQDDAQGRVALYRKPIGVVASITPWNFPVMIAIWHIMPALRAGNTVVIKPSPYTPIATLRMVELMQQALPPGVLNAVAGSDDLGRAISSHPDIDKIVFTGSTRTGKHVMASASDSLKRLTLELGGNDAAIVLPDVDLDSAVEKLFWGAFINNGQVCAAIKRLYVHDSIYDELCDRLLDYARNVKTGDGMSPDSQLGTVQNKMQFERVKMLVEAAKASGARVLCGGAPIEGDGLFYPVTLLADVKEGMAIVDEEQFGPALPIIRYTDLDDAVARANDNPNGLGGSVWSSDTDKAVAIASRLECGSAWINNHAMVRPDAPFGGVKQSGIGVEFGKLGLAEFTTVQVIHQ
ncbi:MULTISPECIES: aldehyde dehydrogenase family protein [unclassified Sphingomonas]|uniref:aldehyde dehydrogenase family protein n=1 Tax=unclassified Sphingomonas TaxID=196159 RepID=UPI0006FCAEE3|nr:MULTISPECIES: aldehyde dehydrogenase family protein [unclassified Sphingomonas]KQX25600.1 aldehyde dehydrogenase [Sphingomonas sp. Root1294]KQY66590.1 aldehyde dehydrogenase [Sphingomonas sp. Root50]KRB90087.1 aldehyde dehydrogenase [Sphingomonas sp. Root720]